MTLSDKPGRENGSNNVYNFLYSKVYYSYSRCDVYKKDLLMVILWFLGIMKFNSYHLIVILSKCLIYKTLKETNINL